jgi:hypothetical protein
MRVAAIVSFFLVVMSMLGCEVGDAGSDEPVEQSRAAQIKGGWMWCIRDRSDLPDGHNIDSWLIACLGYGGDVICSGDTPMCCKDHHCSVDPADVVRSDAGGLGEGSSGDTLDPDPGKPPAVGGQADLPDELAGDLEIKEPSAEPEPGLLERDRGADLEKCLHDCPNNPDTVQGCRRNCMCRTGHRPMSDCDLIDLFQ